MAERLLVERDPNLPSPDVVDELGPRVFGDHPFPVLESMPVLRIEPLLCISEHLRDVGSLLTCPLEPIQVVGELSLAIILLCGASLFLHTLVRLHTAPMPVGTKDRLTMRLPLSAQRYPSAERRTAFIGQLLAIVRRRRASELDIEVFGDEGVWDAWLQRTPF